MNKICLIINKIEELNIRADTFIIGLKNYNNLNVLELELDEIKEINTNKEIIISINKVIHNSEIDALTDMLKNLEGYKIIFDDLSVYQIVKDNDINIELIWGNIHASTNYNSINSLYDLGVKNTIVSPDITLEEMCEIKNNTKSKIFAPIYGKFDIFSSNRFLITNYLKYINKEEKNGNYKIKNKDILYDVYEDLNGTHIIDGKILNGIYDYKTYLDNNIDYVLVNSYKLDIDVRMLIDSLVTLRTLYYDNLLDLKTAVFYHNKFTNKNTYSGFLHKKTVYKVGDLDE